MNTEPRLDHVDFGDCLYHDFPLPELAVIWIQSQASNRDAGNEQMGKLPSLDNGFTAVIQVRIDPAFPAVPATPLRLGLAIAPGDGEPTTVTEGIGRSCNGGAFRREHRPAKLSSCPFPTAFRTQSNESVRTGFAVQVSKALCATRSWRFRCFNPWRPFIAMAASELEPVDHCSLQTDCQELNCPN